MVVAVFRNQVEIPLQGAFDRNDILTLVNQLWTPGPEVEKEAYMVDPPLIALLACSAQASDNFPFFGAILEHDDTTVSRSTINLLDHESVIGHPAYFHDDALIERHLPWPCQIAFGPSNGFQVEIRCERKGVNGD